MIGSIAIAVVGTLKGYDQLLNMVLDETSEYLRGEKQPCTVPPHARATGVHNLIISAALAHAQTPKTRCASPITSDSLVSSCVEGLR